MISNNIWIKKFWAVSLHFSFFIFHIIFHLNFLFFFSFSHFFEFSFCFSLSLFFLFFNFVFSVVFFTFLFFEFFLFLFFLDFIEFCTLLIFYFSFLKFYFIFLVVCIRAGQKWRATNWSFRVCKVDLATQKVARNSALDLSSQLGIYPRSGSFLGKSKHKMSVVYHWVMKLQLQLHTGQEFSRSELQWLAQ